MKKKICCVIQRYGEEINGGAEAYTRAFCEKLTQYYDVTVVTTCALDYQEWSNHYPEGQTDINGVHVYRFAVEKQRDIPSFLELSGRVVPNPGHTLQQSYDWVTAQGPDCPKLVEFLKEVRDQYDIFLFYTYLCYQTVFGLDAVKEKAVLVPFCHDEPYVYLKCYDNLFHSARGFVFNTEEEEAFVHQRFGCEDTPSVMTGIGLDVPPEHTLPNAREKFGLKRPYLLYMGRVDSAKGCPELFEYFFSYQIKHPGDLQLVLLGKEELDIPKSRDIISLGFVSEEEKYAVLRDCDLLVLPSHFESLSIVVLEAFYFKKPVLVSGHCAVLKGHCTKSNGGLYFYGNEDFAECLTLLEENPELRQAMGEKGRQYVDQRYQWDYILRKLCDFIDLRIDLFQGDRRREQEAGASLDERE